MKDILEKKDFSNIRKEAESEYRKLIEEIFHDNVLELQKMKVNSLYENIFLDLINAINVIFDEKRSSLELKRKIEAFTKLRKANTVKKIGNTFDFLSRTLKEMEKINIITKSKKEFSLLLYIRNNLEKEIRDYIKEETHEKVVMIVFKKIKKEYKSLKNKDLNLYVWLKNDVTKDFPKEIDFRTSDKNSLWNDFYTCKDVTFDSLPCFNSKSQEIFNSIDSELERLNYLFDSYKKEKDKEIEQKIKNNTEDEQMNIAEKEILSLINDKILQKIKNLSDNKSYVTTENSIDNTFFEKPIFYIRKTFFGNYNSTLKTIYKKFSDGDAVFAEYMAEKDIFNLKENLSYYKDIIASELLKTSTNHHEVNEIKKSCEILNQLFIEKQENLKVWMKEIIGDSVFEKYKANNPQKIIIHVGETNVGKTYEAIEALKSAPSGMYLAPLRLLALEIFEKLNNENIPCSYVTGEEIKRIEHAKHISSTVEMADLENEYDLVVIDESQLISDFERGGSWVRSILGVKAKEIHIITAPSALNIITTILEDKNLEIREYRRKTPLILNSEDRSFDTVKKGDALILFSRQKVLETARELEDKKLKPAIIYGSMPPSVRRKQVELFKNGNYDVVVATDAIGMGVNLPIEHVFFLDNKKFDGNNLRYLTTSELKQIAGRAGRMGMHENGYVSFLKQSEKMIEELNKETPPLEKVRIKPNYKMFETYIEKIKNPSIIISLEAFLANWEIYEPREDFVEIQKTKKEQLKIKSIIENNITINDPLLLWRIVQMNFDESEFELEKLWLENIKRLTENKPFKILNFNPKENLEVQELEYKKLDLQLQFEEEGTEIYEFYQWKKEEISDTIFKILNSSNYTSIKKCSKCRNALKKDYKAAICPSCIKKEKLQHN